MTTNLEGVLTVSLVLSSCNIAKYKLFARYYCFPIRGIRSQVTPATQAISVIHSTDHELGLLSGQILFSPVVCAMQVENSSKKVTIEKKDKEGMEEKTIKREKWKLSQLAELRRPFAQLRDPVVTVSVKNC
ncbi:uncharacterized protein ACIQIH_008972 [Cyanocitta cristata]